MSDPRELEGLESLEPWDEIWLAEQEARLAAELAKCDNPSARLVSGKAARPSSPSRSAQLKPSSPDVPPFGGTGGAPTNQRS